MDSRNSLFPESNSEHRQSITYHLEAPVQCRSTPWNCSQRKENQVTSASTIWKLPAASSCMSPSYLSEKIASSSDLKKQNHYYYYQQMLNAQFLADLEDEDQQIEVEEEQIQVSKLLQDSQFLEHYDKVKSSIQSDTLNYEEYQLMIKSNEYSSNIEREIDSVLRQLKQIYSKRFPELEQIIYDAMDYVKIVQLVRNRSDLMKIDFSAILTGHQVVAVNVAASASQGEPLSNEELHKIDVICDEINSLAQHQKTLLEFIESRMNHIAPNLSVLVGTQVASRIMAAAGGIDKLATMPAGNIQVMGSIKKNMLGLSNLNANRHRGYFSGLEMVQKAPALYQQKLVRMLATNVAKVARIDNLKTCPNGSAGLAIQQKMLQRFKKIQEPAPAKIERPLPVPDEGKKSKRSGKRFKKSKERLEMTEVRKYRNRLKFGTEAEDEIGDTGVGIGMLSQGIGKVKVHAKESKIGLSKKLQQKLQQQQQSSGNTAGMTSSIAFAPNQGIKLINPDAGYLSKAPESYFKKDAGFRTVLQQRFK